MKRALGVLVLLCGCELAETPPGISSRPRGVDSRSSAPKSAATARSDGPTEQPEPPIAAIEPPSEPEEPAAVEQPPPEGPAEVTESPPRDLEAELRAALGSPVSCLRPRQEGEGPPELAVTVSATVVEAGMVTRAEASSSTLSAVEVDCMRKRALAARLRAPIEDAPRTLTATLTLKLKP